jgi:hypothetical protein
VVKGSEGGNAVVAERHGHGGRGMYAAVANEQGGAKDECSDDGSGRVESFCRSY